MAVGRLLHGRQQVKTCPKCKINKSRAEFAVNPNQGDGLNSWCKLCINFQNSVPCECGRGRKSKTSKKCWDCYTVGMPGRLQGTEQLAALLSRTDRDKNQGCWLWTGALDSGGYASFTETKLGQKKAMVRIHRRVAELASGPIPAGYQVHHKCAIRRCINPDHLERTDARSNIGEMLARNAFLTRISLLEDALRELDPRHPALPDAA